MLKNILFLLIFLALSTLSYSQALLHKVLLEGGWRFRQADSGNWLPAIVPGCVHTDLLDNRLIDDPFYGTNEKKLQWIDKKNWEYEIVIKLGKEQLACQHIELVFDGLDTYAEVRLNGLLILTTDNMFRQWRIDCRKWLKEDNVLNIRFLSPVRIGLQKLEANGYALPNDNDDSRLGGLGDKKVSIFTRKAQFQYGWDWGPRFVTSGIWRPVYLELWDEARITEMKVKIDTISKYLAKITGDIEIEGTTDCEAAFTLMISQVETSRVHREVEIHPGKNHFSYDFHIQHPRLWWTNGLGEPYLYSLVAEIGSGNFKDLTGETYDRKELSFGIRTVKLVQDPDTAGKSFYFKLNGVPVFAKGANYIPADIFLSRITPEDYEQVISDAAKAHMNMLRVWGGGIYENDIFYNLCDKYGILVWQDFMFACSLYPGDSAFIKNVRQEAIDNVKRLRNHPCIALWCGNNECLSAWKEWGYERKYSEEDPALARKIWADYCNLFHHTLYDVVHEYQPEAAYRASSPMASWTPGQDNDRVARISENSGDCHYWDVWHGRKSFSSYNYAIPRFMSEYGFQSFPSFNTVKYFARYPSDWNIQSEVMMHHQKNDRGNLLIREYMQDWYQLPKKFEHFLYVSQLLQAEGIRTAMEAHRRNMPYCMGSLYWQLDDCWPVASWSGMDYYHNWKALHYYAAKAFNPELVSPVVNNDTLEIHVVSDRLSAFNATIEMKLLDFGGKLLWKKEISDSIPANSAREYFRIALTSLLKGIDKRKVVLRVSLSEKGKELSRNSCYFLPFKDLELTEPHVSFTSEMTGTGYRIHLSTDFLAKNLFLELDGAEGTFSDNYFDLFPGSVVTIEISTANRIPDFDKKLKILSLYQTLPGKNH